MRRIARSIVPFGQSVWYVVCVLVVTIFNPDPFAWLRGNHLIAQHALEHISPVERQAAFAVALLVLMFVWFHRQRTAYEDAQPANPNTPLHEALRYIAKDSVWAAAQRPDDDERWIINLEAEFMSALRSKRLLASGRKRVAGQSVTAGHVIIEDPAYFDWCSWAAAHLVTYRPPMTFQPNSSVLSPYGEAYYRVKVDMDQVRQIWPRRSLWDRLRRRSPIERIDRDAKAQGARTHKELFAEQDRQYYAHPHLNHYIDVE